MSKTARELVRRLQKYEDPSKIPDSEIERVQQAVMENYFMEVRPHKKSKTLAKQEQKMYNRKFRKGTYEFK